MPKTKVAGTKLTEKEYGKIVAQVKAGKYLGVSDFIRVAIREKLSLPEKTIAFEEEKKIEEFLSTYPESHPVNVASELNLNYSIVDEIMKKRKKDDR